MGCVRLVFAVLLLLLATHSRGRCGSGCRAHRGIGSSLLVGGSPLDTDCLVDGRSSAQKGAELCQRIGGDLRLVDQIEAATPFGRRHPLRHEAPGPIRHQARVGSAPVGWCWCPLTLRGNHSSWAGTQM